MAADKEKVLEAAQKYADKDQYDKAIREIQKISDDYKSDARVQLKLATYYEKAKRIPEAVETLTEIANLYRNQGAAQKALAIIKQAQKLDPVNCELALTGAELYGSLGLPHEAVAQLSRSIEFIDPSMNNEMYGKLIQMMVRVDSENVQTRIKYAKYLIDQNDLEGACRQYSLALAQLLSKDRLVDYVQTAREYLKICHDDTDTIFNLANIYVKMNRFTDAVAIMSDISEEIRTPEIHELLVKCYTQTRRTSEAVKELKTLARKLKTNGERDDVIEDVWLRAQKLAPNDEEIIMALNGDDDIPMLGASAVFSLNDLMMIASTPSAEPVSQQQNYNQPPQSPYQQQNYNQPPQPPYQQQNYNQPPQPPYQQQNYNQPPQAPARANDSLNAEFSMALEAYHNSDPARAAAICQRILERDEQHMPSLRLLTEIYEQAGDNVSQAYVERKIAKAVYQRDLEEGIRHVLIAEKCTPNAWENYNLMLVFGVDPTQYGLLPPETMGSVSSATQQRVSRQPAPAPAPAQPPVPNTFNRPAAPAPSPFEAESSSMIEEMDDLDGDTPAAPLPTVAIEATVPAPSQNRLAAPPPIPRPGGFMPPSNGIRGGIPAVPTAGIPRPGVKSGAVAAIPPVTKNPAVGNVPPVPSNLHRRMTLEMPAPMQSISNDVISDLRKLEKPKATPVPQPSQKPGFATAASFMKPSSPSADNEELFGENFIDELDDVFAGLMNENAPDAEEEDVNGVTANNAFMPGPVNAQPPQPKAPAAPKQPFAPAPVPQRPTATPARPAIPNRAAPAPARPASVPGRAQSQVIPRVGFQPAPRTPVQPAAPRTPAQPAGIPFNAMQQVQAILQEVDFYASLGLMDDASKLILGLVQEYGDTGIIHDKKVSLGL